MVERLGKNRPFAKRKNSVQIHLKEFGKDVGWSGFSWINNGTSGGLW
jgi:hypothetical protein